MTHLAIVDDHSIVLQGLELMLRDAPDLTLAGLYQNGDQLLSALQQGETINTILMDIHMPSINGVELCKMVKRDYPSVAVIGLSMVSEMSLVRLMIKNGASGYLHKNAGKDEVLKALEKVRRGKRYFSEEINDMLIEGKSRGEKTVRKSPFPRLSRREKEVLGLIVDEHTTQEIADKLFISFGTVETHRRNILSKLGARNTAGLVRIALEYRLLED
ncbi:response regulator [Neolewinella persica]|uniref:response regulator n=1 Tax=Neolewinella persica TaxID=70998 RepID=UPI00036876F7|nr:response regulator transcription factor [Neolewinella persica]